MVTPELASYIWSERKKGVSDYIIRANFIAKGWSEADFVECVATLPARDLKVDPKMGSSFMAQLDKNVAWKAADGKIDLSAQSATQAHKSILKALLWILAAVIIGGMLYIYQDIVWPALIGYYEAARPFLSEAMHTIRMATDFSH